MIRIPSPIACRASLLICMCFTAVSSLADEVELVTGAKLQGTVKAIRAADREFDFELNIAGRKVARTYSYDRVHAVTMKGKRFVVTPKGSASGSTDAPSRTPAEVRAVIDAAVAKPEWFEETKLNVPKTLQLDWPLKTKGWNNRRNVGQYLWDITNPNPGRWRSGVKLIHESMKLHQGNAELLLRDQKSLANMYFKLFQDYPRAAYWYETSNVSVSDANGVALAECYFRLGSKAMAMKLLNQPSVNMRAIKLLGDMGETERAVKMADQAGKFANVAGEAYLLAADALKKAGKLQQAVAYYDKVESCVFRNAEYEKRYKVRAKESLQAIRMAEAAQVDGAKDGVYRADGGGYNGRLEVELQVEAGRISSLKVVNHKEKQFYSSITDTTGQILKLQSVEGIDATTGATITSQAIVNAAAKALAKSH